jgi:DNA-binding NtrC family response regulator
MPSAQKKLDSGEREVLGKSEVLLLDKDETVRDAFRELLAASGVLVTATADSERALSLAREKFFGVFVVDMDTPTDNSGLEHLPRLKAASPASQVILLLSDPTFDLAVDGFRAGAADVVAKTAGAVKYLTKKVVSLCLELVRSDERERALRETMEVHEEFLKRLMDANRKVMEAQDVATGQSSTSVLAECVVLVVDDDSRTMPGLQQALGEDKGFRCISALTGGEALDSATSSQFHIALVKDTLPDLSGTMVSKTLRAGSEGLVLLFTHPGKDPGRVVLVEKTQTIELVTKLTKPDQLVEQVREMRDAYVAKTRERKYIQGFRQNYMDFLKRYVELRQKLQALFPEGEQR